MARDGDREKFVELAEKRVTRALRDIRLIGNLSNRSNYKYTEDDARKICKALREAVEEVRARFDRKGDDKATAFSLK
jgi:ABC-type Fe3+-hydroxamate transport system substrate-binding protein